MKGIFVVIFIGFAVGVSSDFPPACIKMLNMNLFLFDCCEYPVIPRNEAVYSKCLTTCREFDYCCFQECSARESGSYIEGQLNVTNLKEIFTLQKSFSSFVNLTEEWKKVSDESVDKCSAISRSADQPTCEYIYELMACIFKENFLNCPHMKSNREECLEVKDKMAECGKNKGSWRFITDAFNTVKPSFARKIVESHI